MYRGMEKQAAVYSQMRVLLEELAVDKFITLIGKVHIVIFNKTADEGPRGRNVLN